MNGIYKKGMFVKVENFGIELKSKKGFEKGDMHVVITVELTTIVSSILAFQLELIPMFFHMDSIKKFKNSFQSWRYVTIAIIVIGVKGVGDNKGEKQSLLLDGKGEFDQDVLTLGYNFKTKYQQLLKAYNGGQCVGMFTARLTTSRLRIFVSRLAGN